jgi:2-amino-4-hydroxy-6-hydroxymethyldihydropteridine diphosphokinase
MLGAQACLDTTAGDGPLGVLWSSRLGALRASRAALDESLQRGEPAMPFTFIGMQPHLAGALLAQRGHPVTRSAHLHLADEDWSLLLSVAQGWLAECERVLVGWVEESDSAGIAHRSDWCLLLKKPVAGAIRLEPAPHEDTAVAATAEDWIARIAAWRTSPRAPLFLRGGEDAWRFTLMGSEMAVTKAFIGLGANLGDPEAQVRRAMTALTSIPETRLLAASSLYRSAPVGIGEQPEFINAVAEIETGLGARALLDELLAIEARFGRRRDFPGAPRTLDLDLLLYGDQVIAEPELVVPHPRMHERAFVLAPLVEIAPDAVVPGKGPVAALLAACKDQEVRKLGATSDEVGPSDDDNPKTS